MTQPELVCGSGQHDAASPCHLPTELMDDVNRVLTELSQILGRYGYEERVHLTYKSAIQTYAGACP